MKASEAVQKTDITETEIVMAENDTMHDNQETEDDKAKETIVVQEKYEYNFVKESESEAKKEPTKAIIKMIILEGHLKTSY